MKPETTPFLKTRSLESTKKTNRALYSAQKSQRADTARSRVPSGPRINCTTRTTPWRISRRNYLDKARGTIRLPFYEQGCATGPRHRVPL
ncbi:hypothetical protein AVEN_151100-1 [Araneus ventricosus]|nr:hypothetical protein AVEN_151100-1 [Araneus ventricosus]